MPSAILRTVNLPRYAATLTLERSAMYHKTPYVIMGELHGVRYPERYCASEQEAHEYLDRVEAEYRDGNPDSKSKKKSKKSIARAGMKRLRELIKGERAERIFSRLTEMTEQVWLEGAPDYRRRGTK